MNSSLEDIYDRENFTGVIACLLADSLSASGHIGNFAEAIAIPAPGCIVVDRSSHHGLLAYFTLSMASISGQVRNPNPVKENIVKKIDGLTDNPDLYEDGEQPPSPATKTDARNLIIGLHPSGVLAGADVYPYFGAIHINWETARKKVKLIVPPHGSGLHPSIYHGQMQGGKVTKSNMEGHVTSESLRLWLEWLPG